MATKGIMLAAVAWITSIILSVGFSSANNYLHGDRRRFIVYMGSLPGRSDDDDHYSPEDHHISMLQSLNQNKSCDMGCLDPKTAKGKIVVCDKKAWEEVQRVGGVGVITNILFPSEIDYASVSPLPGLSLTPQYYAQVQAYVNSTARPTATLLKSVAQKNSSAPNVASFSSRGPNSESPQINKFLVTNPWCRTLSCIRFEP
ncbi:hypothetical protein QQ045_031909 [Rhodiola kirilowii]